MTVRNGSLVLIFAALCLLIIPLRWLIAWLIAVVVHEGAHYLAVKVCGGRIQRITIGVGGAVMECTPLKPWQTVICCLSGPLGGLLLLGLARYIPRVALCAAMQSVFNLLPVYPLDGGRAVQCAAQQLLTVNMARAVCQTMHWMCMIGIFLLGFWGTFELKLGLMPLVAALLTVYRLITAKIPCKADGFSLQYRKPF